MPTGQSKNPGWTDPSLILRTTLFVILIVHSVPGMLDGGVNAFGKRYLDVIGFSPLGLPIAWAVKLSHVLCGVLLLMNKYIHIACSITIVILVMGIVLVHFNEGWFVVGGGRNGVEYNVLLISVLVYLMVINRSPLKGEPISK